MSNRLLFSDIIRAPLSFPRTPRLPSWSDMRGAWRRYRTRQRISELDSFMLKDIGVTFADAEREANKPFWRL
ncbi:MAG: DUF1127 domain-containing protein [Acetobacteraceae bacterium]